MGRYPVALNRDEIDPYSTFAPFVLKEKGIWKMWYVSLIKWEEKNNELKHYYHIKYAESLDGINWKKEGKISTLSSIEERLNSRKDKGNEPKKKHPILEEILSWIWSIAVASVIMAILYFFVGRPFTVSGQSMYPTLHNGDHMIMSKIGGINRFDVVVLQAPDEDKEYIKRVIGMPGDTVEAKNGVLYINGKEVEQPFINTNNDKKTVFIDDFTLKELTGEDKVPEGKYFVMGDNRGVSKDSRMIGFIDKSAIEGKAVFTVWPLNRIGGLKDYSYLYQ